MVQYVLTPWRDRAELFLVRQQFYTLSSSASSSTRVAQHDDCLNTTARLGVEGKTERRARHQAVARVSMWMQRGNCPHMVESTALLMAAMLGDEEATGSENAASSTYAIRAAYAAAFSRFVTGLLDGHQDKQRKQSMYAIAKTIGLPATFVELRHQSTHEQLPSLAKLRSAAKKALSWIWDYYWKHLGDDGGPSDPCREAVLKYLREEDQARSKKMRRDLARWPTQQLLNMIAEIRDSLPGNKVFLKCAELSRLLAADEKQGSTEVELMVTDGEEERNESRDSSEGSQNERSGSVAESSTVPDPRPVKSSGLDSGWSLFQGDWKPKPIGIVE